MGAEGDQSERTHVSLEPPQEKWLHDPLGVGYPVFLVVGPLALVLSTDCLLIVTYGRVSCSQRDATCCFGNNENIFFSCSFFFANMPNDAG